MLSNRTDGAGCRFLNLSTGACARVDLPELSAHNLEASADGLLLIPVVDVAGKTLLPVEDIGRHQAVFVGEAAFFSLSARTFPCLAGNAVYVGAEGVCYPPVGVRYLTDKTVDPAFQFTTEDESLLELKNSVIKRFRVKRPELNLVPLARPCTLQEYLVCCAGLLGGLKD